MCRKLGIGCVKSKIEYLEDRVKIGINESHHSKHFSTAWKVMRDK